MSITGIRLVDGVRQLTLLPRDGIRVQALEVPMPEVREVTEPRADDDGERDTTSRHGARVCSLELRLTKRPASTIEDLSRFLHPRSRPYLHVTDDDWAQERRLRLRVDQFSAPVGVDLPPFVREVQAQWRAPDGVWEAADAESVTVNADADADGLSFPVVFPVAWPATPATGARIVTNPGRAPSHFVARLYGPCRGPRLTNETTGETLLFDGGEDGGLQIEAGEYLEINTRDRTANYLSQQSRLNHVDFAETTWWRIEPGDQQIRYHPAGEVGPGCEAVITYRPTWLA